MAMFTIMCQLLKAENELNKRLVLRRVKVPNVLTGEFRWGQLNYFIAIDCWNSFSCEDSNLAVKSVFPLTAA